MRLIDFKAKARKRNRDTRDFWCSETSHFALDRNDDDNKDAMTGARVTASRAHGGAIGVKQGRGGGGWRVSGCTRGKGYAITRI